MNSNVENAIQNGYHFSKGQALSEGIDIFKKNPGGFIGYTIVFFLITFVVAFIPLVNLLNAILSPALLAGFYIVAHKVDNNEPTSFGDFFKGFDKFGDFAVLALIQMLMYGLLLIPFIIMLVSAIGASFLSGDSGAVAAALLGGIGTAAVVVLILTVIVILILAVSFMLAPMLIWFHNYKAVDAMKASYKLVMKQWFNWFLLLFLGGILNVFGIMVVFIGLLISAPIVYCMNYSAFKQAVGLNTSNFNDEIEQIGQS